MTACFGLRDASPAIILTTSSAADKVSEYASRIPANPLHQSSKLICWTRMLGTIPRPWRSFSIAYLRYTPGRPSAGRVMISHKNLLGISSGLSSNHMVEYGNVAPPDTTVISSLRFFHDSGLVMGICLPMLAGLPAVLTSGFVRREAAGWMQLLASNHVKLGGLRELRFRYRGTKNDRPRHGRARPRGHAPHHERQRPDSACHPQALRRAVRPFQSSLRSVTTS